MPRLPVLIVLLLLLGPQAAAQPEQRYSEVRIVVPDRAAVERAATIGELDHAVVEGTPTGWVIEAVAGEGELAALEAAGFSYRVLVEDAVAAISARSATCPDDTPEGTPNGFFYGSLNCFPTFDETVAALDAMRAQHPDLITEKESIGQSWEGREIWMMRISAAEDPQSIPEALYTALHHAREPGSLASLLYFMYYLLENYGEDEEVTHLLDTRALYFIPVLNPDGYAFVQTDNLMWRKNRRSNPGGSFGVDLNRNYGYAWDCSFGATSCDENSNLYAGTHPFSEPETQALREWLQTRRIRAAYNYHTFGNFWLHPFGNTTDPGASQTPDHAQFVAAATEITRHNGYISGPGGVVLYPVAGGSDDWMYGEQDEKDRIFAFTPEMGSAADHFWPSPARIVPIARDALHPNLVLARFVGAYLSEIETEITVGSGGQVEPGLELAVNVSVFNLGLGDASDARARIVSSNPVLGSGSGSWSPAFTVPSFAWTVTEPLSFTVAASAPPGRHEGLSIEIVAEGMSVRRDIGSILVGTPGFSLDPPFPNPGEEAVELNFSLAEGGDARLTIYDILGRNVRVLGDGQYESGPHTVTWDTRDAGGRRVAAGLYLAELRASDRQVVQRVTIVR